MISLTKYEDTPAAHIHVLIKMSIIRIKKLGIQATTFNIHIKYSVKYCYSSIKIILRCIRQLLGDFEYVDIIVFQT